MKQVLTLGNCSYDHGRIADLIERSFGAHVVQAHVWSDAQQELRRQAWDLILVNRKFDQDQDDGLEAIRRIKAEPATAATPVMLLSNFPEYQAQAVAIGAEPGFGKAALDDAETVSKLGRFLK